MKAKLLLSLIILSTAPGAVAQVPNGGFETWTTGNLISPQKWSTFGDAEITTTAINGSYSIRLTNDVQAQGPGLSILTNADLVFGGQSLNGGWPYTQRPDSFGFYAKYDLAIGDSVSAVVAFKKLGFNLAFSVIQIGGSSSITTRRFVAPISYEFPVNPDTVIVIIFSHQPDSNAKGPGYIVIDDLFFNYDGGSSATNIDNHNFELVTQLNYDKPDKWFTINDFIFNLKPTEFPVSKSTDAYKGTYSCYLKNGAAIPGIFTLAPGVMITNDSPEDNVPSFPVTDAWRFLNGYYKFNADGGDSAFITVNMYKAGKEIGSGTFYEKNSKTIWTSFSNFIVYTDPQVPDSATIMVGCSNPDNPKGANTELWIDDMVFSMTGAGISNYAEAQILKTSPNPFSDLLQIETIEKSSGQLELLDMTGKTVWSGHLLFGKASFDLGHLATGVYTLRYSNQFSSGIHRIMKQ